MKSSIGIIGSGYMAGIIGKKAKENNIETHCFGLDSNPFMKDNTDYFHLVDIFNIDRICEIFSQFNIQGVIATTELTILPASQIADKLNLISNPIAVSKNITDKLWVRNKIKAAEKLIIKQPEYYIYHEKMDLSALQNYPYIVKPDCAGGKRGVNVVYRLSELIRAVDLASLESRNKKVLIEQFIEGREYSVESLSFHKRNYMIQVTEKESSGAPHCVELAHHQPADMDFELTELVKRGVDELLCLVGIENGPCHTEIKVVNDCIYLIEINARPGGDHIAFPLTELSTGYDYILGIIHCALNKLEKIDTGLFQKNYSGIYFVSKQTAYLKEIFDHCEKYEWFYKKNKVTDELIEIKQNNGFNINYFIYYSKSSKPDLSDCK